MRPPLIKSLNRGTVCQAFYTSYGSRVHLTVYALGLVSVKVHDLIALPDLSQSCYPAELQNRSSPPTYVSMPDKGLDCDSKLSL